MVLHVIGQFGIEHTNEFEPTVGLEYGIVYDFDNEVAVERTLDLGLPSPAIVTEASFRVEVAAPGQVEIGDVAEVRTAGGDTTGSAEEVVIDFGGMRTLTHLSIPTDAGMVEVLPWLGTEFAATTKGIFNFSTIEGSPFHFDFADRQTERLLVKFSKDVSTSTVADGSTVLPTAPGHVELRVNGVQAWFSPVEASLDEQVDATKAVQAALDADGAVTVEVVVPSPAQLTVTPTVKILRLHDVAFPDGASRTLDAPSEGLYSLVLPLSATAGSAPPTWDVHRVALSVRADIGPERVEPPVGPEPVVGPELVIRPERTLLAEIPKELLARYTVVRAVRVPLAAAKAGVEVTGELLEPALALAPVTLEPTTTGEATYVRLDLEADHEVDPTQDLTVAIHVTRGEAVWPLGQPKGEADLDVDLRWRAPNGAARELSPLVDYGSMHATLRLVGEADPNRPIDALTVTVADDTVGLTPTPDGARVEVGVEPTVTPEADSTLPVEVIAAAPGSYTFEDIRITYADPADTGGGSA